MNNKKGLDITAVGLPVLKREELLRYLNDDKIVSKDTKNVGGVNSDDIAVSASGYGRDTVKNALNLGGIYYDEFLQKNDVNSLFKFAKEVSLTHMNEIRNLKDELYQTRSDLIKKGHILDDSLHHGLVDTFNEFNIKYNNKKYDILNTVLDNSKTLVVGEEHGKDFNVGDKIAIITEVKNEDEGLEGDVNLDQDESTDVAADISSVIYTVSGVAEDQITTKEPLLNIDSNNSKIVKTSGEYKHGSFVYARPTTNVTTGKERKTTFLDDINIRKRALFKRGEGFAVKFKIDKILNGALKDFSIKAEKIGNPGGLECFIISEKDMDKFNNIEEVIKKDKENKIIIARSSNHIEDGKGLLKFSFKDSSGRYPLININEREKHCAIIVSNSQNESNDNSGRWEISFSASNPDGSDLYLHNNTYRFKDRQSHDLSPLESGIYVDPELKNLEMNYVLTSIETLDEGYEPYTEGVYTTQYTIPLGNDATNARITLKGNKDSDYIVSSNNIIENGVTETITIKPKDNSAFSNEMDNKDFKIDIGDLVIIGEDVFTIEEGIKGNGQIKIKSFNSNKKHIKLNVGDPIFRCDYRVIVKGYNIKQETDKSGRLVERKTDLTTVEALPTGSIVERFYNSDMSTNKIIFEADFIKDKDKNEPLELTNFEIFVLWNSKYTKNEIKNAIGKNFYGLIGRIDDIAISFNKTVYSKDVIIEDVKPEDKPVDVEDLSKWKESLESIMRQSDFIVSIRDKADMILSMPETTQYEIDSKTEKIKEFILYITNQNSEDLKMSTDAQKFEIQKEIESISSMKHIDKMISEFLTIQAYEHETYKEAERKIIALLNFKKKAKENERFYSKKDEIDEFIESIEKSKMVLFYIDSEDIIKDLLLKIKTYNKNKENIDTIEGLENVVQEITHEKNKVSERFVLDLEEINNKKLVNMTLLSNPTISQDEVFVKNTIDEIKNVSGSFVEQTNTLNQISKKIRDKMLEMSDGQTSNEDVEKIVKSVENTYNILKE